MWSVLLTVLFVFGVCDGEGILAFYPDKFSLKHAKANGRPLTLAVTLRNLSDRKERVTLWLNDTFNNVRYDLEKAGQSPEWNAGPNPGRYMEWQTPPASKRGRTKFAQPLVQSQVPRIRPVPKGIDNEEWADPSLREIGNRVVLVLDEPRSLYGPPVCGEVVRMRIRGAGETVKKPLPWQRKIECAEGVIRIAEPDCKFRLEVFVEGASLLLTVARGHTCSDTAVRSFINQLASHIPIKGVQLDSLVSAGDPVIQKLDPLMLQFGLPLPPPHQLEGSKRPARLRRNTGPSTPPFIPTAPPIPDSGIRQPSVDVSTEKVDMWKALLKPFHWHQLSDARSGAASRRLDVSRDGNITTGRSFDPTTPVSDPYYQYPYGNAMRLLRVFENYPLLSTYTKEESPVVMVIDQYLDINHPEVKENWAVNEAELNGAGGIDDDEDDWIDNIYSMDGGSNVGDYDVTKTGSDGHGHSVSAIITGKPNNGAGGAGMAPNVRVLPCGAGVANLASTATVRCVQYAVANAKRRNIRVINNSYSGTSYFAGEEEVFKEASDAGLIMTCSTGNTEMDFDGESSPDGVPQFNVTYPWGHLYNKRIYGIIGVQMTDFDGKHVDCGYSRSWNYFSMPGWLINSAQNDPTGTFIAKGTSFASPAVAAVVAAMLTVNPKLTIFDILWILENSLTFKDDLRKYSRWGGIPDMKKAVDAARGAWLEVSDGQDPSILPGEERVFEMMVKVPEGYDQPKLRGNLVIYREDTGLLSGAYKVGEIPIEVQL